MLKNTPIWFRILLLVFFILTVASTIFSFRECGIKALFLVNGALYAAMTGMCD
jgi:hypothetical protein